jgi:hypothetical protein
MLIFVSGIPERACGESRDFLASTLPKHHLSCAFAYEERGVWRKW